MIDLAERATLAAERYLPGGISGAEVRMVAATGRAALTLTRAQLEVLTLLAYGVATVRDICTARGFSSTNGVAEHTEKLEGKGLIERMRPADGRAYRYAPWLLTAAGWRTLGPCPCIARALELDVVLEMGGRLVMARHLLGVMAAPASLTEAGERDAERMRLIAFCPWCGWRLW